MKEIYRSFEGLLDVDCQFGYILYAVKGGDLIEYESVSVWSDSRSERARIPARYLPTDSYDDALNIVKLVDACRNGTLPGGQYFFRGKWWSYDRISKISKRYRFQHWMECV